MMATPVLDYQQLVQSMQHELEEEKKPEPEAEQEEEEEDEVVTSEDVAVQVKPVLLQPAAPVAPYHDYILMAGIASLLLSMGTPGLMKVPHLGQGGQLSPLGIVVASVVFVGVFALIKRVARI